jgi:hypothetical protein
MRVIHMRLRAVPFLTLLLASTGAEARFAPGPGPTQVGAETAKLRQLIAARSQAETTLDYMITNAELAPQARKIAGALGYRA